MKHLYKDEVREAAKMPGVPDYFVERHPFPDLGLAVRVIGVFTREKLEVCRRASAIVEQVLRRHGLLDKVWQAFAVVGDDKWVGVKGDARRVGYVVVVRIVESDDAMTADYFKPPYSVLDEVSREVTRSIEDVTMVAYAVTTKPPQHDRALLRENWEGCWWRLSTYLGARRWSIATSWLQSSSTLANPLIP